MKPTAAMWEDIKVTVRTRKSTIAWSVAVLAVIVGAIVLRAINSEKAETKNDPPKSDEPAAVVKLTPEKLEAAHLHTTRSQTRELREQKTVPGRIDYNEAQRVAMNAPAAGVVRRVFVSQEQTVKSGDPLAVVVCPDVGLTRDEVAQRQADLKLADDQAKRSDEIWTNLRGLLAALKRNPDPDEIAAAFKDKPLGLYRESILSAYSKLRLADAAADAIRPLGDKGVVGATTVQEQASNKQVAAAKFESLCEQSTFDAAQDRNKDRAAVEHAQRLLAVSRQRLATLIGPAASESPSPAMGTKDSDLSELVIRPPIDGVVVERTAVDAAHVAVGQAMFVVADTDKVWVSAEVPEQEWKSLQTAGQHELTVRLPSLAEEEATARVKFTEGRVSPETRSVSLVGELSNRSGRFRPGTFVWVSLAVGESKRVLAVPASAVVRHENGAFVFVADGPDSFRRVDIKTGVETPDWVEIKSGLTEGQNVVDQGAFVLKSELLLERESG